MSEVPRVGMPEASKAATQPGEAAANVTDSARDSESRPGARAADRDGERVRLLVVVVRVEVAERVVARRADAAGAVRPLVARVALAALDLHRVPHRRHVRGGVVGAVRDGRGGVARDRRVRAVGLGGVGLRVPVADVVRGELRDVLARAVARARVRALHAAAPLAPERLPALALAGLAVALALVRAAGVVVRVVGRDGRVDPGLLIRAHTAGAVVALPVAVALAHVIQAAVAVAGAAVLARGRGRREDGEQDEELHGCGFVWVGWVGWC